MKHILCYLIAAGTLQFSAFAKEVAGIDVVQDVVYGHKLGLAMTFDVLTPKEPNGAATLFMVSGGWVSQWGDPVPFVEGAVQNKDRNGWGMLLDRGYTIFLVRHGSSPLFKVPDAVADVRQAVRFIRANADNFEIDPERIGVFGGSAGGHLSLMLGTASDGGIPDARNAVDRASNRVAAVVAYFPPTDLEGYVGDSRFPALHFDRSISESVSPIFHVTRDDPPTLLLHGDKDELVPISHSENILKEFRKQGVPSGLVRFPDAGHGFGGEREREASEAMCDWFDTHLTLAGGLVGTWDGEGEAPDGGSNESIVVFTRKDGKLVCVAHTDQGEMTIDDILVQGNRVVLTKEFDNQGRRVKVEVDAMEDERGKLTGTWSIQPDGAEGMRGEWTAVKRRPIQLIGTWHTTETIESSGEVAESTLIFEGSGGDFTGRRIVDGENVTSLKAIAVDGKKVTFKAELDIEGTALTIEATAEEEEEGLLNGRWEATVGGGQAIESGKWSAKLELPEKQINRSAIVGKWKLQIAAGGQELEYELRIVSSDDSGALSGALVSPRSGEYPCKSVAFEDGLLTIHLVREYGGNDVELKYEGKMTDAASVSGTFVAVGLEDQFKGNWKGTKLGPN